MTRLSAILLATITAGAAACSDDAPPATGASDTIPPEVLSTLPGHDASEVAPNADILLRFSEAMSPSAGVVLVEPGDTFTVLDGDFDADHEQWSVNLPRPLSAGRTIEVSVLGFEDPAGNRMLPYTFSFTVQDAPDRTNPTVVAVVPEDGTRDVPPNLGAIHVTFSEPMNESAGRVGISSGGMVEAVEFSTSTQLQIHLAALERSTDYAVTFDGFLDLAGNPLDRMAYFDNGKLNFSTAGIPDRTPPFVIDTVPQEGAYDVDAATSEISIVFSEPMDPTTGAGSLEDAAGAIIVAPNWDAERVTARFPVSLSANLDYAFALRDFFDMAGNPLDGAPVLGDGALDFSVPGQVDLRPPQIDLTIPTDGASDVPVGLTEIVVAFDEPMLTSLTDVVLLDLTVSSRVPLTGVWSSDDTTITFDVVGHLSHGHGYVVDLSAFTDRAGNPMAGGALGDGALDFSILADVIPPEVVSSIPVEGAVAVPASTTELIVNFDEPVEPTTVATTISDGATTAALTGVVSSDGRRVTYDLEGLLSAARPYRVVLTDITDLAGNPLAATPYLIDGALDFATAP